MDGWTRIHINLSLASSLRRARFPFDSAFSILATTTHITGLVYTTFRRILWDSNYARCKLAAALQDACFQRFDIMLVLESLPLSTAASIFKVQEACRLHCIISGSKRNRRVLAGRVFHFQPFGVSSPGTVVSRVFRLIATLFAEVLKELNQLFCLAAEAGAW